MLLAWTSYARAEDSKPSFNVAVESLQRVEVVGSTSTADRREASASKLVVTREDLMRFGDTTIADTLQRVPGISITRAQGRDVEVLSLIHISEPTRPY